MGYAECKTKPLRFRIVHKERPTTGTFSLNTTVYRGPYVDTVWMDRDTNVVDGVGNYVYSYYWNGRNEFGYARKAIPEARFCIGFPNETSIFEERNCKSVKMNEIRDKIGETVKVTLFLKQSQTIPTTIYPQYRGGRDYKIITSDPLTFEYNKDVPGKISSLTIENSSALTFTSANNMQIAIPSVVLRNVVPVNCEQISILNLFASAEVRAKFAKKENDNRILVSPEDTKVVTNTSGSIIIPSETKQISVSSTAESVNLSPIIKQEDQTTFELSGNESTEFNLNFDNVKVVVPRNSNPSIVVNEPTSLLVGSSNTTIKKISLSSVSGSSISASDPNDILDVNEVNIAGNMTLTGSVGSIKVHNLNLEKGLESTASNIIFSSKLSINEGSSLTMEGCSTNENLEISMKGTEDSLPHLVLFRKTTEFKPKSLNIDASANSRKLREENKHLLIDGLTQDECNNLKSSTIVTGASLSAKCYNVAGFYSLALVNGPPSNDGGNESQGSSDKGGLGLTTVIGIVIGAALVVVIIIVAIVVIKRKKNRNTFSSSSDGSNDVKTRLSQDPKIEI